MIGAPFASNEQLDNTLRDDPGTCPLEKRENAREKPERNQV